MPVPVNVWTPSIAAVLLACAADATFGEPPNPVHPVSWMGHVIGWLVRIAPARGPARQLVAGTMIALGVPVATAGAGAVLVATLAPHPLLALLVTAVVLKTMLALRALGAAAEAVRAALAAEDLPAARQALSSLCSRSAHKLAAPELVAASIESVAENTSDSFVAPLLFYGALGLPGAIAYRAVNTMDAMIGYHGRYEYLGKAAARLDDLANIIPARLTALLLLAAGAILGHSLADGWRILRRDARLTESPNAGWPMAAMAGLLGVALEKSGHYRLGDARRPITPALITEAWRIARLAAGLAVMLLAFGLLTVQGLVGR